METPSLIKKLVDNMRPVQPTKSIRAKFALLSVWAIAWSILFLLPLRFRNDLQARFSDSFFIVETIALLIFAGLIGIEVFRQSVPGENQGNALLKVAGGFFAVWVAAFVWRFVKEPSVSGKPVFDFHFICSLLVMAGSFAPNIVLIRAIGKDFALKPGQTGFLAGLSSGALGAFLMQFVCSYDKAPHIFVWHMLPLVSIGFVSAAVTTLWVRIKNQNVDPLLTR